MGLSVLVLISALQLCLATPPLRLLLRRGLPLFLSLLGISALAFPLGADPGAILDMAGRSTICVLSAWALFSSTPQSQVLWALRRVGLPAPAVAVMGLSLRYLMVIFEEGVRVDRAWRARSWGREGMRDILKILPRLFGALIVRAVERGERVGLSMVARGFDGEFRPLRVEKEGILGVIYALTIMGIALGVAILEWVV